MLRLDLTEAKTRRSLRSAVMATIALGGAGPALIEAAGLSQTRIVLSVMFPVSVALLTLARGHRMREWEFVALLTLPPVSVVARGADKRGDIAILALVLTVLMVLAATFAERRWTVAAVTGYEVGLMAVGAALGAKDGPRPAELVLGCFVIVCVATAVRGLRDLSLHALLQASNSSVTDPLTGLINRRGLERMTSRQWPEFQRLGLQVGVLVIDIDHFKRVNDTLGHAAGDTVLQRVGAVISATVRTEDIVARIGGEEFVVVHASRSGSAQALAERIRHTVETGIPSVTVSIGVHVLDPARVGEHLEALDQATAEADRALYAAKAAGRNRVVDAAEDPPGTTRFFRV